MTFYVEEYFSIAVEAFVKEWSLTAVDQYEIFGEEWFSLVV